MQKIYINKHRKGTTPMVAQREHDKVDTNLILPKVASQRVSQPSKCAQGLDYVTPGLAPKKGKRK